MAYDKITEFLIKKMSVSLTARPSLKIYIYIYKDYKELEFDVFKTFIIAIRIWSIYM